MRLTKWDKQAFVEAVMNDVPVEDFDGQVRTLMKNWAFEALPSVLQTAAKIYPEHLCAFWISLPYGCPSGSWIAPVSWAGGKFKTAEPEKYAELEAIGAKSVKQDDYLQNLRQKVKQLIDSCSTLKSARARLPEFEKYLPSDRDSVVVTNLPVANIVSELISSGWPKEDACNT